MIETDTDQASEGQPVPLIVLVYGGPGSQRVTLIDGIFILELLNSWNS